MNLPEELQRVLDSVAVPEAFKVTLWLQSWPNTSGGWQTIGGNMTTLQSVICLYRGNLCKVYFGGEFAYEADFRQQEFRDAFYGHQVPGARRFQEWKLEYGET